MDMMIEEKTTDGTAPEMEEKSEVLNSDKFGPKFLRMKDGCPVIRRVETEDAYKLPEMVMCVATLSDDMKTIKFVRSDDFDREFVSISVVEIAEVERVSASDIDKFAIALLISGQSIIMELIFATEEDWTVWLSGLEVLCPDLQKNEPCAKVTISELVEVIEELQNQNKSLRAILSRYEDSVNKDSMIELLRIENSDLRSVLYVRDDTIGEMSVLIQCLIEKQSTLSARIIDDNVSNASTTIRPHITLKKSSASATPLTSDFDVQLENSTCVLGG